MGSRRNETSSSIHTVIIPDLRGMGLSAPPAGGGYDKKTQGHDIAGVLDALKITQTDLVTHDIGNMVGYALRGGVSRSDSAIRVDRCAACREIGPWDEIIKSHQLWHFSFWGPDEEAIGGRT